MQNATAFVACVDADAEQVRPAGISLLGTEVAHRRRLALFRQPDYSLGTVH